MGIKSSFAYVGDVNVAYCLLSTDLYRSIWLMLSQTIMLLYKCQTIFSNEVKLLTQTATEAHQGLHKSMDFR
jgi:hypothetical protein